MPLGEINFYDFYSVSVLGVVGVVTYPNGEDIPTDMVNLPLYPDGEAHLLHPEVVLHIPNIDLVVGGASGVKHLVLFPRCHNITR